MRSNRVMEGWYLPGTTGQQVEPEHKSTGAAANEIAHFKPEVFGQRPPLPRNGTTTLNQGDHTGPQVQGVEFEKGRTGLIKTPSASSDSPIPAPRPEDSPRNRMPTMSNIKIPRAHVLTRWRGISGTGSHDIPGPSCNTQKSDRWTPTLSETRVDSPAPRPDDRGLNPTEKPRRAGPSRVTNSQPVYAPPSRSAALTPRRPIRRRPSSTKAGTYRLPGCCFLCVSGPR